MNFYLHCENEIPFLFLEPTAEIILFPFSHFALPDVGQFGQNML
jgi:hypothetical protein